jgi:hypothetical protein
VSTDTHAADAFQLPAGLVTRASLCVKEPGALDAFSAWVVSTAINLKNTSGAIC